MTDASIPIEVRAFAMVLYSLAFADVARTNTSYAGFGAEEVSVESTYDELAACTGWTRSRLASVIRSAKDLGMLRCSGNRRTGIRYHVNLSIRNYVKHDSSTARPLFAGNHVVYSSTRQTVLAMDRSDESTDDTKAVARDQELDEIMILMLELGKRTNPHITIKDIPFVAAVDAMLAGIKRRFPGAERSILMQLASDPRVTNARRPMAYLRSGITQGYLLDTTVVPAMPLPFRSAKEAFEALSRAPYDAVRPSKHIDDKSIETHHPETECSTALTTANKSPIEHFPKDIRDALRDAYEETRLPKLLFYGLKSVIITEEEDGSVILVAPSTFFQEILQQHVLPIISPIRPSKITLAPGATDP